MGRDEPPERRSWQELAAEAATETDSRKLMELVTELCDEFERGRKQTHAQHDYRRSCIGAFALVWHFD
jgi:hypothetical protein